MDARRLLDGMPPGQPAKRAVPPVAGGGGSIDALPDGVLEHILGFLPSAEAVQTSVLARRWRRLWKSATSLRIGCPLVDPMSVEELRSLVNHLLVLRQGSPLETCEFTLGDFSGGDDVRHVNLWFRQAVMCRARRLRICILGDCFSMDPWLELDNLPLVSEHLTRLQLDGVRVHNSLLNFSRCPTLEYLEIDSCNLSLVTKISSDSVKDLRINYSVLNSDSRIHIYAPNLASLRLVYLRERTPMLYSMPSLVEGFVRIDEECTDRCNGANYETCDCEACDNSDNMADGSSNSILLKAVSEAKNLALISRSEMVYRYTYNFIPYL
jgi:hypothetical protein